MIQNIKTKKKTSNRWIWILGAATIAVLIAAVVINKGKKVGEISDWAVAAHEPTYKNVLGKIVLSVPANNECTFVSPKPVKRKSQLVVVQDGERVFTLQIKNIKGSTFVTALIVAEEKTGKK